MTGIIHLNELDRVEPRVSRRAMIAGSAGAALTIALGGNATAQSPVASPDGTPVGMTRGETHMTDARDRLRSMLSFLPAETIANRRDALELFSWVDFETHFSALGVTDPMAETDRIAPMMMPLTSTDPLFPHALSVEVQDAIGFSLFEVNQVLSAGVPPERITIYAGGVRFADLTRTWEATGYERKSAEWGDYWTLGENGETNLQLGTPLGMGVMNNVALLEEDTAVFAQTLDLLASVMTLASGDGATAADDNELSQLIDVMPQDTVSALAFPGEAFRAQSLVPENPGMDSFTTVQELLAESDDAVGPMPRLQLALGGVTAGTMASQLPQDGGTPVPQGSPDAMAFLAFLTASKEEAAVAAEVAFWRLENMQSLTTGQIYSERFVPITPVDEAVQGEVMIVRFGPEVAGTGAWASMVMSRDVWPFAWIGEM